MGKRILLVDASRDSRTVYRVMFQHRGFEVLEADSGLKALEVLGTERVDAVVTELTLSPVNGYELLERLRRSPETRELCVVVLTALPMQEERERALRAGCTLFLGKPLEPQRLLREMEALLA